MSSLPARLALAAVACALAATPAHAQGGLLRKMKQKAAQAAGSAVGVEAPGQASSFTPAAPKFDDRVLEITDARVDGMLKALSTERSETERHMQQSAADQKRQESEKKAYDAKYAEYQKAEDAYQRRVAEANACRSTALSGSAQTQATQATMGAKMATLSEADAKKLQARLEELTKEGEAADKRHDQAAMMAIRDSIQTVMQQLTGVSNAEMARMGNEAKQNMAAADKCSDPGQAPVEPKAPEAADDSKAQQAIAAAAAKAAGLTVEQYAVMRERLTYIVGVNAEFRSSTSYAYSSNEIAAVKKRLGELQPYKEQLQMGGTPTWQFERASK